ncbi:MAG TPA: S41 family peptidase [Geobacteraceae bacterium]|nr:S41 family peptidase [Geobacteraceae bacterium]
MKVTFRLAIRIATALLLALLVISVMLHLNHPTRGKGTLDYIGFFKEVTELVKAKYVEPIDDKKLMISAINGMLAALDPHNAYLPPESFNDMQVQMSGTFAGIGIEIAISEGKLTVISPIEDTPAFRAGIKPGDHIWKIDNIFTRSMNISDAVKRMRGPKGTGVALTILRDGVAEPIVFRIKRDIIKIRSVKSRTLEKGFGYVRITQFQETTGEEFSKALSDLRRENNGRLRGLVLDLRNNPGGLVDAAIEVAGCFVGGGLKGGLIVTMKGRDPSSRKELYASVGEKEPPYPLVVMINGGTASASEIVAGALQDYGRAAIVGTQSFGKGSVQSVIPMADGSGLKLTTARYYTPKGRSIQVKGITPDIMIGSEEMAKPAKDAGHDFREEDLDNHILPPDGGVKAKGIKNPSHWVLETEVPSRDYQLSRSLGLLKGIDFLERAR